MASSISRSTLFTAQVCLAVIFSLLLGSSALAQSTQTTARPDRGINPGGAYSVSDIESISLTNGNMNLSIPLASLPPIAGGKLGLTLRAIYNSKLWDVYSQEKRYRDNPVNPVYTASAPRFADRGGWYIGSSYAVIFRNAHDDDFGYLQTNPQDDYESNQLPHQYYRAVLVTPDGSEHNLYPSTCSTGGYVDYTGGHRHDYLLGYCKDNPYASGAAKSYYTADGTYISAVITPSSFESGGPTWTLYMRDGTQVIKSGDGVQRIKDTNGNKIKIFTDSNGTHYQDEQSSREIRLTYSSTANNGQGQYQVWYQTVAGHPMHIDINMKSIQVKGVIYNTQSWNPEGSENGGGSECTIQAELTPSESIKPMVEEIVFPATEPNQAGQQYSFSYNSAETSQVTSQIKTLCQMELQSQTRETSAGLGELSRMEMPSGAIVEYTYNGFGTQNGPLEFADPTDMARRYVSRKRVKHDGTMDDWNYTLNTDGSGGSVKAPDNSETTEKAYPHDHAYSHYFGMTGKSGLAYRTVQAGKVMVERHWTLMPFSNAVVTSPGSFSDHIPFNTVVDAEYTTLLEPDSNGNPVAVKMSAKKYKYDYNGNLLEEKSYDWFDPSLVTRDTEGVPTDVPTQAVLLREVKNKYYNSATDSNGAPDPTSPNVYAKRSVDFITTTPTLLVLNAQQETIVGASKTRFSYDGQTYGTAPTTGKPTTVSSWNDIGNSWINTTTTYDSYGNVATTTDARGKVTQIFYEDLTHAMPTRVVVNPQNDTGDQTSVTSYDFSTGAVLTQTDPNNQVSTIDYTNQLLNDVDPFGRPGATYSPAVSVNGSNQRHKTTTTYIDSQRQVITASDLNSEGDGLLKSRMTADELGRTVLAEQSEDGANYTISSQTVYEQAGKVTFQSNPRRGSAAATDGWTRSTTDELGRVTKLATFSGAARPAYNTDCTVANNCTGAVTSAYYANYTTITDQAGKERRSKVNALGQLVRIDEPNASGSLGGVDTPAQPTSYTYNVLGNLTQVSQGVQTRTFTYSSLSRLTSATNPEAHNAQGVPVPITYQYDNNGNLTQKVDARGVTTTYSYDALNRVISRAYQNDNSATPAVYYKYDSQSLPDGAPSFDRGPSVGRLVAVLYGGANSTTGSYQGYDALGRVKRSLQRTNDGQADQTYTFANYDYNLAGELTSQTYPSGKIFVTEYDNAGRLAGVKKQGGSYYAGTSPNNPNDPNRILYMAQGAVKDMMLGNGLWEHTEFNSRSQPIEIRLGTTKAGVDRLKLEYGYGAASTNNGHIQSQTITVPGGPTLTQNYEYDELNRLKTSSEQNATTSCRDSQNNVIPCWKQSYSYDRYGNRRFNQALGQTTLPLIDQNNQNATNPAISELNNQLSGTGYGYDAAGNLKCDPANPCNQSTGAPYYEYDAENKLVKAGGGATIYNTTSASYFYDGGGKRVKKVVGNTTTVFVYNALGQLVAEYSNQASGGSGISYLTGDHLGNTRIVTGSEKEVKSRHDYLPFGEEINLSVLTNSGRMDTQGYKLGDVRQKFTGKERDIETGLDYFGARYYTNIQGRFTTVDPMKIEARHLVNPQDLNRYSYVSNSPLVHVDPDGQEKVRIVVEIFIPSQTVLAPGIGIRAEWGFRQFRGDYDSQGRQVDSRLTQTVQVETDPRRNGGAVEYGRHQWTGETQEQFVGTLDPKGGPARASGDSLGMTVYRIKNSNDISAYFHGAEKNPLVAGSPAIDYALTVIILVEKDGSLRVRVWGERDNFPAYRVNIQREGGKLQTVYLYDPRTTGASGLQLMNNIEFDQPAVTLDPVPENKPKKAPKRAR